MIFNDRDKSHDFKRFLVTILDRYTDWIEVDPCTSKFTARTAMSLRDFLGVPEASGAGPGGPEARKPMRHTDNSGEFQMAAKKFGCMITLLTTVPPPMASSNAVTERYWKDFEVLCMRVVSNTNYGLRQFVVGASCTTLRECCQRMASLPTKHDMVRKLPTSSRASSSPLDQKCSICPPLIEKWMRGEKLDLAR